MNLRDLFTHLCTVSVKTFLLTLRGLFYLRFFHLILGSNPGNLIFTAVCWAAFSFPKNSIVAVPHLLALFQ